MIKISESQIESFAIQLFKNILAINHFTVQILLPADRIRLRVSLEEVVLKESLRKSVQRINHKLPVAVCEDAVNRGDL